LKQGLFEFYTAFESIKLTDGANSIDMCVVNDTFHDFVYLIDLDGSFRPNPFVIPALSTLVASDNKKHMTFANASKCTDNPVGCYSYCQDTCFRSMRYVVEDPEQGNFTVKVCSTVNQTLCSSFKGGRRGDVGPHEFTIHLPVGQSYETVFVNSLGIEVTPSKVTESVEKTFCPEGPFSVTLKKLSPITQPVPAPIIMPVPVTVFTVAPILAPSMNPTKAPTKDPSKIPTSIPTLTPTNQPTKSPTKIPTNIPSPEPTRNPTKIPTAAPTQVPTSIPTRTPTNKPTKSPTNIPTNIPSSIIPTKHPTMVPFKSPTNVRFLLHYPFSKLKKPIIQSSDSHI
jgi:hypothetical protein